MFGACSRLCAAFSDEIVVFQITFLLLFLLLSRAGHEVTHDRSVYQCFELPTR